MPLLPELPSTPQTQLYRREFLEQALARFNEREAVWLLLSVHHYGWRAHRDMAAYLLAQHDLDDLSDDQKTHQREHRAMAALEELFLLLDQIWRMVKGIRSFRDGQTFLTGYRSYGPNVQREYEELQALSQDDWRAIFSLPADVDLPEALRVRVPVSDRDIKVARVLIADLLDTTERNMREAGDLFTRVDDAAGAAAQSVRDINNAYRHGTQVVYEDCAPEEIPWRAGNPEEGEGLLIGVDEIGAGARNDTVNVLVEPPDEEGHARFASMPRDAEWAATLLESMQFLSVLLHRLAVSFVIGETTGEPVLGTLALDWDGLSAGE